MRFLQLCCLLALISLASVSLADEAGALFLDGAKAVTFKLKDKQGKTPRLILFGGKNQVGTADSINYWRDTRDPKLDGVAVDFKGIRFLRTKKSDDLIVRLIGIKNELELGDKISLADLQRGKILKLHFGPAALGFGPISGTTDADMTLSYDPKTRTLEIPDVSGQIEWKRPFNDAQKDSGSLQGMTGDIGEVPAGGRILKPAGK